MSPAELLKYVQSFRFGDVKVELRGKDKWCVLLYGYVLRDITLCRLRRNQHQE